MNLFKEYEHRFPIVIDSSMRVDYCACPRKFYLRHVLGLAPIGTSIHLTAGSAYADALETFRKSYYGAEEDFETARARGVEALLITYGNPDFDVSEAKQWYRMVDAFLAYLVNWNPATDYMKPAMFDGKPAVEFSFALPIHEELVHPQSGDPLLYVGRFDMLGKMNNTLFVEDDKTTGRLGQQWSGQWDLRSQFTGYCWGAQQYGHPVGGAIIRGTAILKTKITHAEAIVYRPKFMIQRWLKRLQGNVAMMCAAFEGLMTAELDVDAAFPNYGEENGSCASYSGCSYKMLCESPDPANWVDGNFEVSYWDPTHGAATAQLP
jgi:hypothetical protein